MSLEAPRQERSRRRPVGLLVLVGSVLASFIWWMASRPAAPTEAPQTAAVEPAPPPVPEPEPVARAPEPAEPAAPAAGRGREAAPPKVESPAPRPAAGPLLRVTGDVDGADVFVDRTFVGKTPFESREITPGTHQINISAAGYDGVSQRVDVRAGEPTEVTFALKAVRLDASVDVVHRHRFGSCEGRLTADLSGFHYRPAEGDDGFTAPLDAVDRFTVDYQDKTLTLKLKTGRSYNFTTRTASADPLLVFHRDVEKARAKLSGAS